MEIASGEEKQGINGSFMKPAQHAAQFREHGPTLVPGNTVREFLTVVECEYDEWPEQLGPGRVVNFPRQRYKPNEALSHPLHTRRTILPFVPQFFAPLDELARFYDEH